jgi:hypothetical protein
MSTSYPSQPDIPMGAAGGGDAKICGDANPDNYIEPNADGSVNIEINGVIPAMGNGTSGTTVIRVTLASDSTGQVTLAAGSQVIGHVINDASSAVIGAVQQATTNAAVAAGTTTAAQVLKGTPGYLSGVIITAADASGVDTLIYDHATLASGTVIGYIPGNAALGTYWPCNMPAELGITAGKLNHSLGLTVAFS